MTQSFRNNFDVNTNDAAFWSTLKTFRQELHSDPFPSGSEGPTIQKIRNFLERYGTFSCSELAGGRGLLVESPNKSEIKGSPSILVRADVDALPIKETSGKPHTSKNEKYAHSCGHDGHTTTVCGLAILLAQNPARFGNISFVFQPAEETGEGAQWILNDVGFNPENYDTVIGFHNIPESEFGVAYAREGVICAASCGITICLSGETSHAASPEKGRTPVPAIQRILDELNEYITSESHSGQFLRITTTGIHTGGPNFGITPGEGNIWLTLRTLDTELLDSSKVAIESITRKWADEHGLEFKITYSEEFHATVNNSELASKFEQAMQEYGIRHHTLDAPYLWSEDFGRFSTCIPGLYFGIGAGPDTKPLHHSAYDFPDELLRPGIVALLAFIQKLIR